MSRSKPFDQDRLQSSLLSYSFAQEDISEKLPELQIFLRESGVGIVDINELKDRVNQIKKEEKNVKQDQQRKADLFTRSKKIRKYQFGSSFCPNCHMYKNYEKECPYCKYLEMTF